MQFNVASETIGIHKRGVGQIRLLEEVRLVSLLKSGKGIPGRCRGGERQKEQCQREGRNQRRVAGAY